jgi:hypothetical protein
VDTQALTTTSGSGREGRELDEIEGTPNLMSMNAVLSRS